MTEEKQKPIFLLSILGGGIRGLIPLYILYYLEQDFAKQISADFDMYAGTSVGSIIISNIVYKKRSIKELIEIYNETVFKQIFTKYNSLLTNVLYRPLYDSMYKTKLFEDTFTTQLMTDTDKKVLITVYCVDEQKPMIIKSYKIEGEKPSIAKVSEVVSASSSPPMYFSAADFMINNKAHIGIDGAVFANNPTDFLYADALRIYGSKRDIRILTLGTGDHDLKQITTESKTWGAAQWVTKGSLVDILLDTNQVTTDYKVKHFANALGHKYLHVDKIVKIGLDDITKIDELKEIALQLYTEYKEQLRLFFN